MKKIQIIIISFTAIFILISCSRWYDTKGMSESEIRSMDNGECKKVGRSYVRINNSIFSGMCNPSGEYISGVVGEFHRVVGADADSFEQDIYDQYARDKNYVYDGTNKIDANKANYFINNNYSINNDMIYCHGKKLDGADTKTFIPFNNKLPHININYSKDKNSVYFLCEKLDGADPKTFTYMDNKDGIDIANDKNNIYYKNKPIENIDPYTFKIEDWGFAKDKDNVYYCNEIYESRTFDCKIVKGLDTRTFASFSRNYVHSEYSIYYCNNYVNCEKVEGANESGVYPLDSNDPKNNIADGTDGINYFKKGKKIDINNK